MGVVGRRASSTSRRGVVDGVGIEVVRLGGRNDDGGGNGVAFRASCPRNPPAGVSEPPARAAVAWQASGVWRVWPWALG